MSQLQASREYLSYVTLMIHGKNLEPVEVSRLLHLRPSQSWKRGESTGRTMPHPWGGWKKSLPKNLMPSPLPTQLRYWVRTLRERTAQIRTLERSTHLCALNCYIGSSHTASIIIPVELQQSVAALGLELHISFFANEPDA